MRWGCPFVLGLFEIAVSTISYAMEVKRARCDSFLASGKMALQVAPLPPLSPHGAHGVMKSHPPRMWKALGSNPNVSTLTPWAHWLRNLFSFDVSVHLARPRRNSQTPTVGLEPTTTRLRALRSAD